MGRGAGLSVSTWVPAALGEVWSIPSSVLCFLSVCFERSEMHTALPGG